MQTDNFSFGSHGQYSWFTKDRDRVYTGMCLASSEAVGLPAYAAEMRVRDIDLPWSERGMDEIEQDDWRVLKQNARLLIRYLVVGANGDWFQMAGSKAPGIDGNITGQIVITPASVLYNGWPHALCYTTQTLRLTASTVLTRQEMLLAHGFLNGIPRKVMAEAAGVSVKAIEKRLAVLREKLRHKGCRCYSLHGCLGTHHLSEFLMAQSDWFDPLGTYQKRVLV